jgi:hypothetical protein
MPALVLVKGTGLRDSECVRRLWTGEAGRGRQAHWPAFGRRNSAAVELRIHQEDAVYSQPFGHYAYANCCSGSGDCSYSQHTDDASNSLRSANTMLWFRRFRFRSPLKSRSRSRRHPLRSAYSAPSSEGEFYTFRTLHGSRCSHEVFAHQIAPRVCVCSVPPPWLSWQGESWIQSFDLDGIDSIPGNFPPFPTMQITCFVDHFNKLA